MQIQINTDKNVSLSQEHRDSLRVLISKDLSRYEDHITRVEVHLSDENGSKDGQNDKRCMIEARPEGMQPIAVTENADSYEKAVTGAVQKLISTLGSIIGRLRQR